MTFKGMLKILVNDYKKQHEEKMFSVVDELMRTRRELKELKEQLRNLQLGSTPSLSETTTPTLNTSVPLISLFVQYNGFFNELCDIRQTITIRELLVKLRRLTGIDSNHSIHIRVLSEDGLTTVCLLDNDPDCTLEFYEGILKPRMILSIEGEGDKVEESNEDKKKLFHRANSEQAHSFESDV